MVDLKSTGIQMITKKTSLKKVIEFGRECKKCGNCCSYGTGFLAPGEEDKIAGHLMITKKTLEEKYLEEKYLEEKDMFNKKMLRPKTKSKPFGECVFLKNDLCGIHEVKPLQCKIGNCCSDELSAWFLLNHIIDVKDPEAIRQYKVYLDCGGKIIDGGELEKLVPDKEELEKILSFEKLRR